MRDDRRWRRDVDPSSNEKPLELEAQADELEAQAFHLRARAKRLRSALERPAPLVPAEPTQLTRSEYAKRSRISEATVSRYLAEGMPMIPVGSTVRIDPVAADDWRCERGRRPTKARVKNESASSGPEPDVSGALARSGLRVVGQAR
jgi:hypothetical protein